MGSREARAPACGRIVIAVLALLMLITAIPPARADSGGPDAYGYRWTDSKFPNPGVSYGWIDGVLGGQDLGLDDDNCTQNRVPFQFPFRFYGTIYNDVSVCANGFLAFNNPASYATDTDAFVVALGGCCPDLNPAEPGGGHVFGKSDLLSTPKRFIVTWNGVYNYLTTDPQKFEIVLTQDPGGQDGQILLQYASLVNPPPQLTGIESPLGSSSLFYASPLQNSLAVLFYPPTSGPPGDVLTLRSTNLSPATAEPGQKDVPMLRVNVSTPTGSVTLRRVRVDVTGTAAGPGDVSTISLWRDGNGDGVLNASLDPRLVGMSPVGTPGSVSLLLPSPISIPAGTGIDLFVTFDLSLGAPPGDWIGAGILTASYLTVDAPDNVSSANFPINSYVPGGRTQIVEGVDTLRVAAKAGVNPPGVRQWQTDVPIFWADLTVNKGAVTVTGITVTFNGTRRADVFLVKLFEDTNRDLVLQPASDRLLAEGRFNATGNVMLGVSLQFLVGSTRTLLLSYDIAPDAVAGDLVGARVPASTAIAVQGGADRVDPANFPVETPTPSTVQAGARPAIESRWAVNPPNPDGRLPGGEYILSTNNSKDLSLLGGNTVATQLTVENDATYLYLAYDALGDLSAGSNDAAAIAFQTNRTAFPGAPPDDEFGVGGPMGPFHAVWNTTSLQWQIEDACNPAIDANHTGLACAIGFDRSPLSATFHRIYEFRIPLRLLEVPLPVSPGSTVGFAAESNWSLGLEDRDTGRNASWPFADPAPPPRWYGLIMLAMSPPPNTPPRLDWTGEPGYVGSGLYPDNGTTYTSYSYRILYSDANGDLPALGEPTVHVVAGGPEIPGSPFPMREADPADRNVIDGKVYATSLTFSGCPQTLAYFFTAWDDAGANATPTPTLGGPSVRCPPSAPVLWNGTVAPALGYADSGMFTWSVGYKDADGDPPARIHATIYKAGTPVLVLPLSLQTWLGAPGDFVVGAVYGASQNLSAPGNDYGFSFLANDSLLETSTPQASGPNVVPEPSDQLLASFFDDTPVVEDAGRSNVKMFTGIFQADANSVTVTGLRVDRVSGASVDGDVAAVRVYHDVDMDGYPSGADVLLGQGPLSGGSVQFSGFALSVTAGTPVQIIVLIDISPNAAADDRLGLRVLDARSITVAPPDIVKVFSTFFSSRLLVNRAPSAVALTAEGNASGTAAVRHLINPLPRFGWTFSDPNINAFQAGVNVSVVSGSPGTLLWFTNISGVNASVVYNGSALQRGVDYRLTVRVFDNRVWGPPGVMPFRLNTPPSAPTLSNPPDLAANQGPSTVLLQWSPAADADSDFLSYRWTLATRPDFGGAVSRTTALNATSASVVTVPTTTYYWKLEAFDQFEWGPASPARSFTTGATRGGVFGRVVHAGVGILAVVGTYDGSGNLVREVSTSPDGTFAISDIPFGTYEVRVTSPTYRSKVLPGVTLGAADPVKDLGNIELDANAGPGVDWTPIALYGGLVGVIAIVVVAIVVLLRRRRGPEAPAVSLTPESWAVASEAVGPPEVRGEEPGSEREALPFECPECGTAVAADAKSCPGCGAIFE